MKNKRFLYAPLFIPICLLSCNNEHLEQFNFNRFVKVKLKSVNKIDSFYHFPICDGLPFKWEKIIVLRPDKPLAYIFTFFIFVAFRMDVWLREFEFLHII